MRWIRGLGLGEKPGEVSCPEQRGGFSPWMMDAELGPCGAQKGEGAGVGDGFGIMTMEMAIIACRYGVGSSSEYARAFCPPFFHWCSLSVDMSVH